MYVHRCSYGVRTCPVVDATRMTSLSSGSNRTSYASMGSTLGCQCRALASRPIRSATSCIVRIYILRVSCEMHSDCHLTDVMMIVNGTGLISALMCLA